MGGMEDRGFTELADLELAHLVRDRAWESGGSEAFWTLWLRYEKQIWRTVKRHARVLCPRNVAGDVFALAVLERVETKLLQGVARYRGPAPFGGFLARVIYNAAIDQYRYYKLRPETPLPETEKQDQAMRPVPNRKVFPSPERRAITKEAREIIQEALSLVARRSDTGMKWAGALRRHYLEESPMTAREIASEMGCSEDLVNQYLTRGKKAARRVLEKTFGIERGEDLMP